MITLKNLRLQGLLLLLLLLLPQLSKAQGEEKHTDNSFTDNTTVGINFGLGMPWGRTLRGVVKEKTKSDVKANLGFRFGVVLGYGFPLDNNWKVGPEIGISHGTKRYFKVMEIDEPYRGDLEIEEAWLAIPLALHVSAVNEDSFLKVKRFSLGYEFDIFFSTKFKVDGHCAFYETWKEDINLKEKVSDLPGYSGSILFKSTFGFSKGFYFTTKVKIPIGFFRGNKDGIELSELNKDNVPRVAKAWMPLFRAACTSTVEIDLGIDIMKLIF